MSYQDLRGVELFKNNNAKYTYRRKLVVDKLLNKSPFELVKGGKVVFDSFPPNIEAILEPGNPQQADEIELAAKNQTYVLRDLKKSKEFGGGGRAGSTADTQIAENLQCVYLAAKYEGKTYDLGQSGLKEIKSHSGDLTTAETLKRVPKLSSPEAWHLSSIAIAEVIYKKYGGRGYTFRRGDSWVNSVYKLFKKFNTDMERPFSQGDKWNPADIWMTKGTPQIPKDITNLLEYNAWFQDKFKDRTIIPISLKQNRSGTGRITEKMYDGYKAAAYKFDGYTIGMRGYETAKNVTVYYQGEKGEREMMLLRGVPAFVGEIQGPNYRIGKITYSNRTSPLGRRLVDILKADVPETGITEARANGKDPKLIDEFYQTYKNIVTSPPHDDRRENNTLDNSATFRNKVKNAATKDGAYVKDKFIGMKIIDVIANAPKKLQDDFISSVVQYAKSESELSCVHIIAN